MPFADAFADPYFRRPQWEQELPSFPVINMGKRFPDALEEEIQALPYTTDMFSMLSRSYDEQQPRQSPMASPMAESPAASMPRPRIGSAMDDAANAYEWTGSTPAPGSTFAPGPRRYGGAADYLNMLESASQMDQRSRELTRPKRMRQYDALSNLEDQLNMLLGSNQTLTPERMAHIGNVTKLRDSTKSSIKQEADDYEAGRVKANAPVRAAQADLDKITEKNRATATAKALNAAMLKGTGLEGLAELPELEIGTAKDLAEQQRKTKELEMKKRNYDSLAESRAVMNKWRNALRDPNKALTPDQITRGMKESMVAVSKLQDIAALEPDNLELAQELEYAKAILKGFTEKQAGLVGVERPAPAPESQESDSPGIFDYFRQKLGFAPSQPAAQPAARPAPAASAPSNALRRAGQLAAKVKAGTANPAEINMHNRLMEQLALAKKRTKDDMSAMDIAARTVFGDL